MRRPSFLLVLPLIAACNPPVNLPTGGLDISHPEGGGICDASAAQKYVGQTASDELAGPILGSAGAKTLRWGGPDTAFTTDYREDRVNVMYDARGMITRVNCG